MSEQQMIEGAQDAVTQIESEGRGADMFSHRSVQNC